MQAYITNFAVAHTLEINDVVFDSWLHNSPAIQYWYNNLIKNKNTNIPNYHIFQTGKDMQGLRNSFRDHWTNENFINENNLLYHYYVNVFEFYELNEYLLTSGKLDFVDGWHFTGPPKLMEAMIFINILCNNIN